MIERALARNRISPYFTRAYFVSCKGVRLTSNQEKRASGVWAGNLAPVSPATSPGGAGRQHVFSIARRRQSGRSHSRRRENGQQSPHGSLGFNANHHESAAFGRAHQQQQSLFQRPVAENLAEVGTVFTGCRSASAITIPAANPARSAGLPERTSVITTPWSASMPNCSAICDVRSST